MELSAQPLKNLRLIRPHPDMASTLLEALQDQAVMRFLPLLIQNPRTENLGNWLKEASSLYSDFCVLCCPKPCGYVLVSTEGKLEFALGSRFRGQGLMQEAITRVVQNSGFNPQSVEAEADLFNLASTGLLKKLFRRQRIEEKPSYYEGRVVLRRVACFSDWGR